MNSIVSSNTSSNANTERIAIGMAFASASDAGAAAIQYAEERKFAVVTIRSDKQKVILGCKHHGEYRDTRKAEEKVAEEGKDSVLGIQGKKDTQRIGCNFRINLRRHADGRWYVASIHDEHNHPLARSETIDAQHRKLNKEGRSMVFDLLRLELVTVKSSISWR